MATNTGILGLVKPTYEEDQDVTVLNSNFDLIDAEAGRVRNNFAGTYSASRGYAVGDYCVYTGNLYRCTTTIGSGGEAWNASHWTQVKVGDELDSLNDQIAKVLDSTTISGSTLAEVQTSLVTLIGGMSDLSVRQIKFTLVSSTGQIEAATYYGKVTRHNSTIAIVEIQSIAASGDNSCIGTWRNSAWSWNKLALNDQIANLIKKTTVSVWSSESINAGSYKYKWVSIANACPSGYVPIGVALECSNVKCIANFVDGLTSSTYLTEGTICVHNLNSGSNESVDVNMVVTCMKA